MCGARERITLLQRFHRKSRALGLRRERERKRVGRRVGWRQRPKASAYSQGVPRARSPRELTIAFQCMHSQSGEMRKAPVHGEPHTSRRETHFWEMTKNYTWNQRQSNIGCCGLLEYWSSSNFFFLASSMGIDLKFQRKKFWPEKNAKSITFKCAPTVFLSKCQFC